MHRKKHRKKNSRHVRSFFRFEPGWCAQKIQKQVHFVQDCLIGVAADTKYVYPPFFRHAKKNTFYSVVKRSDPQTSCNHISFLQFARTSRSRARCTGRPCLMHSARVSRVDEVIASLGLESCRNTKVRKRLRLPQFIGLPGTFCLRPALDHSICLQRVHGSLYS